MALHLNLSSNKKQNKCEGLMECNTYRLKTHFSAMIGH